MRVASGRFWWNLAGSLGVLLTLVAITVGLPAVDRAVPAERPVASTPYDVGGGVSVVPPPGAVLDVTRTRPGATRGMVLFLVGPVRYLISVAPFGGNLDQAAARLRSRIVQTRGYQVAGTEFPAVTDSGLPGRQGGYSAPGRSGRYVVYAFSDVAIEVTIGGSDLELRGTLQALETSIRSIKYTEVS